MVSLRGLAVAVSAAGVYAALWLGYRQEWGWLDRLDSSSLTVLYGVGVKHPGWVQFWQVVCAVFGPTAFRLLAALFVVIALARRRVRVALFLLLSVELSGIVTEVAKGLAARSRPATALVTESSLSFPSGHALGAMVGVLALGMVLWPMLNHPLIAAAGGALIVLAVGFGRVALNVHHPSDVVAGCVLGYLYVALCAWAVRPWSPGPAQV